MNVEKRRAYAVRRLRSAFAGAARPDIGDLVGGVALTNRPAIESVRARFTGKLWDGVRVEDFDSYDSLFCYLSNDACRYYLPGLMLHAVETADRDLIWNVLDSIGLTSSDSNIEHGKERIGVYGRDQIRALASAVRAMASIARARKEAVMREECMDAYRELRRCAIEVA